ncbi:MAG TPA: Na/Pi cotransporter family protein [Bacillus bacterium]|uniref:Na/Pi symporter n=1 Tax=Siminovitchia fordii TaxID=254759 RepID=UPI000379CDC9|nr:Na/Pi symporter [Siminovitchia fordii]HBZ09062.1 Na/Pi cotransporter family protein [Bacillus sp. (in: firmicutes)]
MLYIFLFLLLAGCFLLGMTWMRIGLFNLSGSAMERWLRNVTNTPIKSMIAGIFMTVILQSSSAVTVITVGLVSARILTFPQTIGIVLGTNIGTTVTLEILSFDLSFVIIPLLSAGTLCLFFRNVKVRSTGFIFMGIGIIFASMNGFGWLSSPLTSIDYVHNLINHMEGSMFSAFIIGTLLTAVIQSGTVVTGIAMSFIGSGIFSLETGILIMMGSNIGTCSTALLAGIGAGNEARLTAYAHLWLNIFGVLVFLPFISNLADWSIALTANPETQLAHASVIFNIICSLAVLPFATQFGQFIVKLHKKKI